MKHFKILFTAWLTLIAGAACQAPALVGETPLIETTLPPSEPTEPAAPQANLITADNLNQLVLSASLQVSNGAVNCAWSSDSNSIAVMDMTWAGLYTPDSFELDCQFTGDEYTALYAGPPDATLAAYSLDGITIQFYDFTTKADRFSLTPGFQYAGVFFSPDGSQIAVESVDAIEVVVYDTTTGEKINTLSGYETAAPVYSASFSPDGSYLLWLSRGTAQPMEITGESFYPALSHEDFIAAARMSHDNYKVATAAAGTLNGEFQALITLWGTQTGETAWQAGNVEYFSSLDFSADDSVLAAGTRNEVVFYDTKSGQELSRLRTGGDVVNSLGFSPDGQSLLTCSTSGKAKDLEN